MGNTESRCSVPPPPDRSLRVAMQGTFHARAELPWPPDVMFGEAFIVDAV